MLLGLKTARVELIAHREQGREGKARKKGGEEFESGGRIGAMSKDLT